MKPLTKNDIKDFPDLGYMPDDVIEQILKNQEDAKKLLEENLRIYREKNRLFEIVERLKKRIEELEIGENYNKAYQNKELKQELQKILEDEE